MKCCTFNLDSLPAPNQQSANYGLWLRNCASFQVEGNTFTHDTRITSVSSSGLILFECYNAPNGIYHNSFGGLTYALRAAGPNDSIVPSCNAFNFNGYDIYVPSGATLSSKIGSATLGADNTFRGTQQICIYNAGPQNLDYYYSNGTGHAPVSTFGSLVLHSGSSGNPCRYSWNPIYPIGGDDPIKTEEDSTADTPNMDPPKSLSLGDGSAGTGLEDVRVFPNPAQTQFTVVSEQGIVNRIRLYDVYGKLLRTMNVNANMAEVDVRELCAGVYVLRVETDNGMVVKRVVRN